jgi:hypothetical protein
VSLPPFAEALSIGEAPHHFESHPADIAPLDKPIPHAQQNFALSWRDGHRICRSDTKVKQVPQGLD